MKGIQVLYLFGERDKCGRKRRLGIVCD